jgi:hypothetical protein
MTVWKASRCRVAIRWEIAGDAANSLFAHWGEVPSECETMRGLRRSRRARHALKVAFVPLIRRYGDLLPAGEKRGLPLVSALDGAAG